MYSAHGRVIVENMYEFQQKTLKLKNKKTKSVLGG